MNTPPHDRRPHSGGGRARHHRHRPARLGPPRPHPRPPRPPSPARRLLAPPAVRPAGTEGGRHWTGTEDAARLFPTVRKPALHAVHDAHHAYRAELTAYITEPVLSPAGPVLHTSSTCPTSGSSTCARTSTRSPPPPPTARASASSGSTAPSPPTPDARPPQITDWTCAHGDFHPANLTTGATILDWEGFGPPPAAGTRPCCTRTRSSPAHGRLMREAFADTLETPTGRIALLVAAADLLQAASRGDHPELVPALRALIDEISPSRTDT
ncbi:hypothetical protein AB6O49_34735 [Streptomyces sp. SBR177]